MSTTIYFIDAIQPDTWAVRLESYDAEAIAMIREVIPRDRRAWDKPLGIWGIWGDVHAQNLAARLRAEGYDVQGIETPDPDVVAGAWALDLLRAAPPTLRPKIIRALARVLHPDIGGVHELMRDLNEAAREVQNM